jgi:hypothetical protein
MPGGMPDMGGAGAPTAGGAGDAGVDDLDWAPRNTIIDIYS